MIAFTCDIDWAPEEVIADTISLFEKYNVKCTFFSTHHSEELSKCNKKLFETAIHPNFNLLLTGSSPKTFDDILDEILDIHPEARGVRSHSMMQSSVILKKFADKNLIYDANHFLPYCKNVKPFKLWTGMVRIPYNWEDDVHWTYGYDFDRSRIDLMDEGLNIFDFHPIHIFINTENKYRYLEAKKFNHDAQKLLEYRNTEIKGTRDLLISLLEHCKDNKILTKTHIEIANDFININH